ncbi:uncharacterized protein BDZ99DRAFT_528527 [Mytilinidion resinicola]|uniref:Uncharacterized protein n=1 Tax=Mytilinidion resinicola TaxID=574789 RepID=A0A6A6XY03_9PEZI|nr:uncharacterized protein BDZ99DRAFT_528527 [Mytilinidion resinicola]KAF2801310.1 hypothetical protein BDZ99DRAFT_528527 [Mytilinidion resinicola]
MPYLKLISEELLPVLKENLASPLMWSLLLKPDTLSSPITATAFAYTSLVSGLLSTFFSFYVQQVLSELHRPEDVYEWLTTPRMSFMGRIVETLGRRQRTLMPANRAERIPSLTAAATLTAPSGLLTFSIVTLFIVLGVYLDSVYKERLSALKGRNANLAVLLFFIIFAANSIIGVLLPLFSKRVEQFRSLLARDEENPGLQSMGLRIEKADAGASGKAADSSGSSDTDAVIRRALEASIHAQKESLKAQKALLKLLL